MVVYEKRFKINHAFIKFAARVVRSSMNGFGYK